MNTVKVYRIENEQGLGPYWAGEVPYNAKEQRMPPPWTDMFDDDRDKLREWGTDTYYAMPDMVILKRFWRLSLRKKLQSVGFKVTVYVVTMDYLARSYSGLQVAFKKDAATLVSEYPLVEPRIRRSNHDRSNSITGS